jgi:hypothetical protein
MLIHRLICVAFLAPILETSIEASKVDLDRREP